jgi:hypothetical protein
MKNIKSNSLAIFCIFLSAVALYQSHSNRANLSLYKEEVANLDALKKQVLSHDARLSKLDKALRLSRTADSTEKLKSNPTDLSSDSNNTNENIRRLGTMNPAVLDSLDKKYQNEVNARNHQSTLIERRLLRQKADVDKYGNAILDLARRANGNTTDGDEAFNQLLTNYSDTSIAGSAIAERALSAAIDLNTNDVEKYYNQLVSNANYKDSVTEQGIEATPALQGFLARQYISSGRFEEANSLIESLNSEYGDQYVPEKGEGSRPEWNTGSDIAKQLRQELQNATSGNYQSR